MTLKGSTFAVGLTLLFLSWKQVFVSFLLNSPIVSAYLIQWTQDQKASKRKKDVRFYEENGAWLYRQKLIIHQAYCSQWKIPWLLPEVLFVLCIPTLVCCKRASRPHGGILLWKNEESSLNIEIMVVKHPPQKLPFLLDNQHSSVVGRHNHDCKDKDRDEILKF